MKVKNYILAAITITITITIAIYISFNWNETHRDAFECRVRLNTEKKGFDYKILMTFIINERDGIVLAQGEESSSNEGIRYLHRKVHFNFKKSENNHYFFTNQDIEIFPDDNVKDDDGHLDDIFPDFYLSIGKKINVGIYPVDNGDYIIINGRTHLLYCNSIR